MFIATACCLSFTFVFMPFCIILELTECLPPFSFKCQALEGRRNHVSIISESLQRLNFPGARWSKPQSLHIPLSVLFYYHNPPPPTPPGEMSALPGSSTLPLCSLNARTNGLYKPVIEKFTTVRQDPAQSAGVLDFKVARFTKLPHPITASQAVVGNVPKSTPLIRCLSYF